MKLGLSSYTYGWAVGVSGHEPAVPLDEHGLLEKVRTHGLKLLQVGDNLPLHTFSSSRLQELARHAQSQNIELEIGARRLDAEQLLRYAEVARVVGANLLRFVVDDRNYHPPVDQIIRILRENLSALSGLRLGVENHDRLKASEFRQIIDSVGAENVGICLDTANSLGAGEDVQTVVAALAPVTLNLHIKDFHVKRLPHLMGFTVTGCPAGKGLLDIPRLFQTLAPFGRCHSAILEQWTPPEPQIEQTVAKEDHWATESINYLKPLFA